MTTHLLERMRQRRIAEEDVLAVLQRPLAEERDAENNSYKLYGHTGDGRKIYVAVKDTTWGTPDPVIKTVVEVS
ncbi:DUF4258 domain-containing protein [Nocardiopsis dassonvillei]|jgi:hypothetical protein|uniref:DUF4258 domain-containing protein n=1 Tax=Nocardiopsis dassonvillei TaxID=2014 RepID=UPI00102B80F3|nr:DUF4258 domain-containing protein [Nocardiopsis dassonvillei]MCP3011727.1 DUF4258 domain-containing protein [Nocardiopsis dassonvillei]